MKVLMLNGSPKPNGNTMTALTEVGEQLKKEGIDYEIFQLGTDPVRDCIGCGRCGRTGNGCVFTDDAVNEFIEKLKEADGLIVGSPVYYAHPTGRVQSFLDRVFYAGTPAYSQKPAASVTVARRAGTTASWDVLNKYFAIAGMPIVPSTYWNVAHGCVPGEAEKDAEGMQTMRNLARNMAWMLKLIEAGDKAGIPRPEIEGGSRTNFIR